MATTFDVETVLVKEDNPVNCQNINPVETAMVPPQSHFYQMGEMLPKLASLAQSLFFTNTHHSHSTHHQSTQFHTCGRVQIGV